MVDLNELRSLAARVAASADLIDVRLFNLESTLEHVPASSGELSYSFESEVEVQESENESAVLLVDGTYDVKLRQDADGSDDGDPDGGSPIAQVKIHLAALYEIHEGESVDFTDEELDAFAKTTGLLALHPYARELISNLTSRMGLPTLHVGTVRIPLDKRNGDG